MTEAAEASKILVNLLRTTPYTAYLAMAAAAALWRYTRAAGPIGCWPAWWAARSW